MRVIMVAGVLAAALAGSSAPWPQHVHHNFCLKTGSAQECAYDSFAQCEAAKRGNADFCDAEQPAAESASARIAALQALTGCLL